MLVAARLLFLLVILSGNCTSAAAASASFNNHARWSAQSNVKVKSTKEYLAAINLTNGNIPRSGIGPFRAFQKEIMTKAMPVSLSGSTGERIRKRRRVEDADDDADAGDDYYEPDYGEFGFNVTQYSLKYASCASLSFVGGDKEGNGNEDDENIFRSQSFVILRLCPSDTCYDYTWKGCKSNYGQYMLTLQDYLEAFQNYHEVVMETYCNYCEQCMYFEQYFYGNYRKRRIDDVNDVEDDGNNNNNNNSHACKYYDACSNYESVCNGDDDDVNDGDDVDDGDDAYIDFEYDDFFECTRVDGAGDDDGNEVFLGPYCNPTDHQTITIGIFSDEWCTQYIGDQVNIYEATGMLIEEDALYPYYNQTCISCHEGDDLPYNIADAEDDDSVMELCEGIYMPSAKCEVDMLHYLDQSYTQQSYDSMVCEFIEYVALGKYDENGFILLDASNTEDYQPTISETMNDIKVVLTTGYDDVTKVQKISLAVFCIGCSIMIISAIFLRMSISRAKNPFDVADDNDRAIMSVRSDGAFD